MGPLGPPWAHLGPLGPPWAHNGVENPGFSPQVHYYWGSFLAGAKLLIKICIFVRFWSKKGLKKSSELSHGTTTAALAAKFCVESRSGCPKRAYGDPFREHLGSDMVPSTARTFFFGGRRLKNSFSHRVSFCLDLGEAISRGALFFNRF